MQLLQIIIQELAFFFFFSNKPQSNQCRTKNQGKVEKKQWKLWEGL